MKVEPYVKPAPPELAPGVARVHAAVTPPFYLARLHEDLGLEHYKRWLLSVLSGREQSIVAQHTRQEFARLAVMNPHSLLCPCPAETCVGQAIAAALAWYRQNYKHVGIVGARPKKWKDPKAIEGMVKLLVAPFPQTITVVSGHALGVDRWAEEAAAAGGNPVYSLPVTSAMWDADRFGAAFARNTEVVEAIQGLVAIYNGIDGGTHDTVTKARAAKKPVVVITPDGNTLTSTYWSEVMAMIDALPTIGNDPRMTRQ